MNTELAVGEDTCVVYSHTFSNGAKYFGNGVSEKRATGSGGRGAKYLEQLTIDPNPLIEILATGLSPSDADTIERQLFDIYKANGGLVIQRRPSGTDLQWSIAAANSDAHIAAMASQETRDKQSTARRGRKNSPEAREKISKSLSGRAVSEETKEKIRIARRGKNNGMVGENHPMFDRTGALNPFFGKTHPPEVLERIRLKNLGRKRSSEFRDKQRKRMRGEGNHFFGKTHSPEAREKISLARLGKPSHRKVISMLDGRVTSSNNITKWNKKNPDYCGTWVDL